LSNAQARSGMLSKVLARITYVSRSRTTRVHSIKKWIALFLLSVSFRRMPGPISTAKRGLGERRRSWYFTTCCETQLVCHSKTLSVGKRFLVMAMMCFNQLSAETGRRRTWQTGLHLSANFTITRALIPMADQNFGANG